MNRAIAPARCLGVEGYNFQGFARQILSSNELWPSRQRDQRLQVTRQSIP